GGGGSRRSILVLFIMRWARIREGAVRAVLPGRGRSSRPGPREDRGGDGVETAELAAPPRVRLPDPGRHLRPPPLALDGGELSGGLPEIGPGHLNIYIMLIMELDQLRQDGGRALAGRMAEPRRPAHHLEGDPGISPGHLHADGPRVPPPA